MIKKYVFLVFVFAPYSVFWGCSKSDFFVQEVLKTDSLSVTNTGFYKNPVLKENTPDPSVIKTPDGEFYLYSTESKDLPNVPIYKSKDLISWSYVGTAFNNSTRPKALSGDIWAPDINLIDGRYVLYYSISEWGGVWDCGIGVAIADKPQGPFEEYSVLFNSREIGIKNSIDPFYLEDENGKFLFWGSHGGIYGISLSDDGLSVLPNAKPFRIAGNGGEGTYIHKRGDYYYLFVSMGSCCNGFSSTYHIVYGRSQSLKGPYIDKTGKPMLEGNGTLLLEGNSFSAGTGHNAEFVTDDTGEDWILYHGYNKSAPESRRVLHLDHIIWDNGWPLIIDNSPSIVSTIPYFKN